MKALILFLTVALAMGCAPMGERPEEHGRLVCCEYYCGGGMENTSLRLRLKDEGDGERITVERNQYGEFSEETFPAPGALRDLEEWIAEKAPETWAELPEREFFALDAPSSSLSLTYADGSEFVLSDDVSFPEEYGPLLWEAQAFLESYTVSDAQTFALRFSSFGGSGAEYRFALSTPEKVRWSSERGYAVSEDTPENMIPPGTAYEDIYTFYGRIPGTVELRVWHTDPNLAPVNPGATDDGPRVYTLVIDEDFNVVCQDDGKAP